MHVADNARLVNRKSSNDRKIARMARILTIFGPKRSQRRKLFDEKFLKNRSRRDDRFRQKIVKIRAILAIFRPFEDFGDFRFDRFDIFFDSIDTEPNDRWGPPCTFLLACLLT